MRKFTSGIYFGPLCLFVKIRNIYLSFCFYRFECMHCSEKFPTVSLFDAHKCTEDLMRCSCGQRKPYIEGRFWRHFKEHLNASLDFCFLCSQYFPTVSFLVFSYFLLSQKSFLRLFLI